TGLLRQWQKLGREDHVLLRAVPAQQRLEAMHAAGLELHDRLEHQAELLARESVSQVRLDAEPGLRRIAHGEVEHLEARTPLLLGVIRSEEHTSELQSRFDLVCRLLL